MANFVFDLARDKFLNGQISWSSDTIKVALIKDTIPSVAQGTDDFYAGSTNYSTYTVGTPQALTSKTSTAGVANAGNVTFAAVPAGNTIKYLLLYKDTGTTTTSPVVALIDTTTGAVLPLAANGGDMQINWDTGTNKIFKL